MVYTRELSRSPCWPLNGAGCRLEVLWSLLGQNWGGRDLGDTKRCLEPPHELAPHLSPWLCQEPWASLGSPTPLQTYPLKRGQGHGLLQLL